MGWFTRLFGGGALSNPDIGAQSVGPTTHTTESGITLTDERAMSLSALWACARIITLTVCGLPLSVFERIPDGRKKTEDHYLHDLLRISPNALMNPLEFRQAMTLGLVLWNNSYAKIDRDKDGIPRSLTPLRSNLMTPVREVGTVTYHYQSNGREYIFAKDSILHLSNFTLDGIVGLSPLDYARNTMGISVSADKFASKSFQGSGRYRGFISVDRLLTTEQRKALADMYQTSNADDVNTWVFEAGAKFNQTNMSPDDMQMLESRAFQLSEVARFWGVPSYLLNDTEKSTSWGTGLEQQNLGFLTYTIQPYLNCWEAAIANDLLTRTDRRKYFVEHNVEGLLRADSAARALFYSQMVQNGLYTRNEVRRKENMPPVDGGDDLTVQVNLTPVDQLPKVQANGNENPTD